MCKWHTWGHIESVSNNWLKMHVETLCVHIVSKAGRLLGLTIGDSNSCRSNKFIFPPDLQDKPCGPPCPPFHGYCEHISLRQSDGFCEADPSPTSVDEVRYEWSWNSTSLYVFRTCVGASLLFLPSDCCYNRLNSFDCCRHSTSYRNVKNFFRQSATIRHQTCVDAMSSSDD